MESLEVGELRAVSPSLVWEVLEKREGGTVFCRYKRGGGEWSTDTYLFSERIMLDKSTHLCYNTGILENE